MSAGRKRAGCWARHSPIVFVAATMFLAGCTNDEGRPRSAQRAGSGEESEFIHVLNDVQQNPGHRSVADAYCQVRYGKVNADFSLSPLIEGLLEVPEADTAEAFCLTMVDAVVARDLSAADLVAADAKTPEGLTALGKVMRGLLVAHERRYAQQAQKPSKAQSCSCGQ